MKRVVYKIIAVLLSVLLVITPFQLIIMLGILLPDQYADTFVGALDGKMERLYATQGQQNRVIVVGGSSVAFGVDSALMERYLGGPVVNFGLYAALGTKMMMELSLAGVGPGDTVILSPEPDAQTLSLYFSAENALPALDGNFSLTRQLDMDDRLALLGGMWQFSHQKLTRYTEGATAPEGVYRADSFDERGDLRYPRPESVMHAHYYDPNTPVRLSAELVSEDFAAYVRAYVRTCEERGATVYFAHCPINALALTAESDVAAYEARLSETLGCKVLGSLSDHVLEPGYFYDSNFHVNDAGAVAHTVALTRELLLAKKTPVLVDVQVPAAPALPEAELRFFGEDENDRYFTFEKTEAGMRITGLTPLGKTMQTLTLPLGTQTYKVTRLGAGALEGGVVKSLIIPREAEPLLLENDCFAGSTLTDLWICQPDPSKVSPPIPIRGVAESFVIHVPAGASYETDYFWMQTGGYAFRHDAVSS